MNNPLTLIFTFLILNTFLLIILAFWIVNKDCPQCRQEKPINQLFKRHCETCERSQND